MTAKTIWRVMGMDPYISIAGSSMARSHSHSPDFSLQEPRHRSQCLGVQQESARPIRWGIQQFSARRP